MKRRENHRTESVESRASEGSLRALIVDDESLARQGIRMLLKRDAEIGLIEEASNGKQAAELMLTGGFDLIFLDVQMPEMDGFSALRQAGAQLPGAVIFAVSYTHLIARGHVPWNSPHSARRSWTDPGRGIPCGEW